jgi:hypothetical protein
MDSSAKTKASTPLHRLFILRRRSATSPLWYNLHFYIFSQKGEKVVKRALMTTFLAIHAKGGESISPKQKDRTTTNFKNLFKEVFQRKFQIGILLI